MRRVDWKANRRVDGEYWEVLGNHAELQKWLHYLKTEMEAWWMKYLG